MADWEFQITGLEVTGQDNYGWPTTQVVDLSMPVQENNIIRLYKSAWRFAEERFPNCCAFNIKSVERMDKPTNKDYGFHDNPGMLVYQLNQKQQAELRQIRNEILEKAVGDSKPKKLVDLLFSDGGTVKHIADNVACLKDYSHILTHEEANEVIAAIEKFYSRLTPLELSIVNMDDERLSHEDLEVLRLYRDTVKNAA